MDGTRVEAEPTYVDETDGPAQLVIGLRDSDRLIVRDRKNRLAVYKPGQGQGGGLRDRPGSRRATAPGRGGRAARGRARASTRWPAEPVRGRRDRDPSAITRWPRATSTAWCSAPATARWWFRGPRRRGLGAGVRRGQPRRVVDAFAGNLVSSRQQNNHRALEEVPGLHALSPGGEQLAYRTIAARWRCGTYRRRGVPGAKHQPHGHRRGAVATGGESSGNRGLCRRRDVVRGVHRGRRRQLRVHVRPA